MNFDWKKAAETLRRHLDYSFGEIPEKAIAVACSGGADSLAVLLLTWAHFTEQREQLCVLHYDHSVRNDSAADADFVREVCKALNVLFVCGKREACENAHSESDLRRLRLDFFRREMLSRNIGILIQGHQRDDVAETLLMRLTRGAGTEGLSAPKKQSRQSDGRLFVRPLLETPKSDILAALRKYGIPWREDSSNTENDYFRNRIRNRVLPELRAVAPFENIARSRMLLEEDATALDFFYDKIFNAQEGNFSLKNLPKALVRRYLMKEFSREKIKLGGAAVADAFVEAITAGKALKVQIGDKKIIWDNSALKIFSREPEPKKMIFEKEKITVTEALFEKIRSGIFPPTETVFLAGTPEIVMRSLLPGEKFRPLGAPGEKAVRRIFIDKKIPEEERNRLPVFADGTGIAWIPGLPPAERFRIRNAGSEALRLTYRNASLV